MSSKPGDDRVYKLRIVNSVTGETEHFSEHGTPGEVGQEMARAQHLMHWPYAAFVWCFYRDQDRALISVEQAEVQKALNKGAQG
jgi:hypothetical protein